LPAELLVLIFPRPQIPVQPYLLAGSTNLWVGSGEELLDPPAKAFPSVIGTLGEVFYPGFTQHRKGGHFIHTYRPIETAMRCHYAQRMLLILSFIIEIHLLK